MTHEITDLAKCSPEDSIQTILHRRLQTPAQEQLTVWKVFSTVRSAPVCTFETFDFLLAFRANRAVCVFVF